MHTMVHENIKKFMEGFTYDAHPMGVFVSTVGALSTFYPDGKQIFDEPSRGASRCMRLIAKVPTIAAYAYRHSIGRPYVYPDNDLSFTGNFLNMLFKMTELKYKPNPVLERALDVLFILHADHEQNCSTSAMRGIGSSHVDPVFGAGRRGGGALRPAARRRQRSRAADAARRSARSSNIPDFIKRVKAGEGRLMGFGHRVYKSYDPRAKIIKRTAYEVFEVTGKNPLLDIALELERIALEDDYFVTRKLYPNVDFYSGLIYQAMGFPVDMFPVLFAIARTVGWVAQWEEMLLDPEQKIARPRQIYTGSAPRDYVPMDEARVNCDMRTCEMRSVACPFRVAASRTVCMAQPCLSRAARPVKRHPCFDGARAFAHLQGPGRDRPARRRHAGERRDAAVHHQDARRLRHQGRRAAVRNRHADRACQDGQRHRHLARSRPERIVIASHFDTKLFKDIRFVGASDGASSTAALLELGRVLKDTPRPFTIELLFLDGEEAFVEWAGTDHTYGSRYYVAGGAEDRHARQHQGAHPARHDRRPQSRTSAAKKTPRAG